MNEKIGADTSYRTQGRVEALADEKALDNCQSGSKTAKEAAGFDTPLNTRIIKGRAIKSL